MDQVWLVLHFLELGITTLSFKYHVAGVYKDGNEPMRHTVVCCGISSTFLIYQIIDIIRILTGGYFSFLFLMIAELLATLSFYITAITSMYHAEQDVHLQYMDNKQEARHPFFNYSKAQSVTAIGATILHLLHCCLLVDVFLSNRQEKWRNFANKRSIGAIVTNRRLSSVMLAQQPINLAVCHQRFEFLVWAQKKLQNLFKKRGKSVVVLPSKFRKSDIKKSTGSAGSVRFTMGYM
ncbi:hypothetical protein ACFFRR_007628 [Megaselia abdita]